MTTLNNPGRRNNKTLWIPGLIIAILAIVIVTFFLTTNNETSFSVTRLNAKNGIVNLSKGNLDFEFNYNSLQQQAMLIEKNDLLLTNDCIYLVENGRIDSISVNDSSDSLIYVNDKLYAIVIDSSFNLLPALQNLRSKDIQLLRCILINSRIPETYYPYLKKIASQNTGLSIEFFEKNTTKNSLEKDVQLIAPLFSPRFLCFSVEENQLQLLAQFKTIENLYLDIQQNETEEKDKVSDESADTKFVVQSILPALPKLKQLILMGDDPYTLPTGFLKNNTQVERLTIMAENNFSFLDPLKDLTELNLLFVKIDMHDLPLQHNKLQVINLNGDTCLHINVLNNETNLKWLGLPRTLSQTDFNNIIQKKKSLEVLQLIGNSSVTDFHALQQLTNLRGLIISDTVTDIQTVATLKQLRYLSIPDDNFQNKKSIDSLAKALPGCIIVPNSGACMGSGWILLLFPLVIIFYVAAKYIQKNRRA